MYEEWLEQKELAEKQRKKDEDTHIIVIDI